MAVSQRVWMTHQHGRDESTDPVVGRSAPGASDIAESGMVVTVRYDDTGETETFVLGRRFGDCTDLPVYSTLSPLGRAVTGARPGERRMCMIPQEARPVFVTVLSTAPCRGRSAAGRS